jgi:hypothetical protein
MKRIDHAQDLKHFAFRAVFEGAVFEGSQVGLKNISSSELPPGVMLTTWHLYDAAVHCAELLRARCLATFQLAPMALP